MDMALSRFRWETSSGYRTIRSVNSASSESEKNRHLVDENARNETRFFFIEQLLSGFSSDILRNVTVALVYGYGAYLCVGGSMTIGALVAFAAYVPSALGGADAISSFTVDTKETEVHVDDVESIFALPLERDTGDSLTNGTNTGLSVEFRDVTFHYSRGFGVKDLSLSIAPGEFVGIVGPSGEGKSTLIDMLMGFYPPESGQILINGRDMNELSLGSLREHIGHVPQDVFLWWNRSMMENITYPRDDVDVEKVHAATRATQIHDFITKLPDGYDHVFEPSPNRGISGGEAQRIAIARALLRDPALMLMDEATSAVDAITEKNIRDAVEAASKGRTTLVVAHRLATVINAHRIIVIDDGRIVEEGTPAQLVALGGLFAELYEAQRIEIEEMVEEG
jgi:ABC-type multidrug transport system fused ATPase/permease subunit